MPALRFLPRRAFLLRFQFLELPLLNKHGGLKMLEHRDDFVICRTRGRAALAERRIVLLPRLLQHLCCFDGTSCQLFDGLVKMQIWKVQMRLRR